MTIAFIVALIISQVVSITAICVILLKVEKFLSRSLIFMKSKDVHDVLAASSLIDPSSKITEDEGEVVMDLQKDEEAFMKKKQKEHMKHLESDTLGA